MWQAALLSDAADCYFFFKTMWCFINSFPIYTPNKSTGFAATHLFNGTERFAVLRTDSLIRRKLPQYFTGSTITYFGWGNNLYTRNYTQDSRCLISVSKREGAE